MLYNDCCSLCYLSSFYLHIFNTYFPWNVKLRFVNFFYTNIWWWWWQMYRRVCIHRLSARHQQLEFRIRQILKIAADPHPRTDTSATGTSLLQQQLMTSSSSSSRALVASETGLAVADTIDIEFISSTQRGHLATISWVTQWSSSAAVDRWHHDKLNIITPLTNTPAPVFIQGDPAKVRPTYTFDGNIWMHR